MRVVCYWQSPLLAFYDSRKNLQFAQSFLRPALLALPKAQNNVIMHKAPPNPTKFPNPTWTYFLQNLGELPFPLSLSELKCEAAILGKEHEVGKFPLWNI